MKTIIKSLISLCVIALTYSCSEEKVYEKGFSVSPESNNPKSSKVVGLYRDSVNIKTRPTSVLSTGYPEFRITTIYKLNYNEKRDYYYTGSNSFYRSYNNPHCDGINQWNYNFMPGLKAIYGYNMVNVSLKNVKTQTQKLLFEKPVLIKTLYIPSFTNDTLKSNPIKRDYYMISAYNEDTNEDGFINIKDLRRFFVFDLEGNNKELLVPENYSVISSEYDCANDYMYIFAQLDADKNGQVDDIEEIQIFWIDLKNPRVNGVQYN